MSHGIAYSLGAGLAVILLAALVMTRWFKLSPRQSSAAVALGVLGVYVPIAILTQASLDLAAIHLAVYLAAAYVLMIADPFSRLGPDDPPRHFHWGPLVILGFFVVVAAMDSIFITVADRGLFSGLASGVLPSKSTVSTAFPGVVSHDFQEKEGQFNAYQERRKRQEETGWRVRKGWLGPAVAGQDSVFQVQVLDAQGLPLVGGTVNGRFLRPSDSTKDQDFSMDEIGDGYYRYTLRLPEPGLWDLVLEIERGESWHEIRGHTRLASAAKAGLTGGSSDGGG